MQAVLESLHKERVISQFQLITYQRRIRQYYMRLTSNGIESSASIDAKRRQQHAAAVHENEQKEKDAATPLSPPEATSSANQSTRSRVRPLATDEIEYALQQRQANL